jgi:hypothetical protein
VDGVVGGCFVGVNEERGCDDIVVVLFGFVIC